MPTIAAALLAWVLGLATESALQGHSSTRMRAAATLAVAVVVFLATRRVLNRLRNRPR